jgi:hypothetical protein
MWVKAKKRGKNKEKHVNGAMFLTLSQHDVSQLGMATIGMLCYL